MSLNPQTTALVILDGQNDFLSEGGVLYDAIQGTVNGPEMIEHLNRIIAIARKSGIPVINTMVAFSEGYKEAGEVPYGIFAAVGETGGFLKGTWGAQTAEELDVNDGDIVLEKPGMSAFLNPEFEKTLNARGIKTLVLAGMLSNACVECTMRAAYDRGFEVYNISDAITALDSQTHDATVEKSFPLFSKSLTTTEFAAQV